MRIIAGAAKGRRLHSPSGGTKGPIRPTSDRAREALFSILGSRVQGAKVVDLFAGTGALALEALSRGASFAVLVDSSPMAVSLIRRNVEACGFSNCASVLQRDLSRGLAFLKKAEPFSFFDIIFLDPPYGKNLQEGVLRAVAAGDLLAPEGLVIAEERTGLTLPESFGSLSLRQTRCYGDTAFWFYEEAVTETKVNGHPHCQKAGHEV